MAFTATLLNRLHSSAAAALTDRQRARFTSERVQQNNSTDEEEGATVVDPNDVTATVRNNSSPTVPSGNDTSAAQEQQQEEEEGHFTNEPQSRSAANNNNNSNNENDDHDDDSLEDDLVEAFFDEEAPDDIHDEESLPRNSGNNNNYGRINNNNNTPAETFYRSTMTLAELEEERELARRRMSACVLLTVFVLFKLWIDCIAEPSVPLLMVCLIGTSWTARWIRYNREREEELDRRIAQYLQAHQVTDPNNNNNTAENAANINTGMDRNDLRMLSFQAQLALAIMESQRHMLEGGRPDGEPQTPGVSAAARSHWKTVDYQNEPDDTTATTLSSASPQQYGSTAAANNKAAPQVHSKDNMDGPHCSICLCEYETGDTLSQLPCGHVYHQECIDSWTSNHTKCPLCNFDLESVLAGTTSTADQVV